MFARRGFVCARICLPRGYSGDRGAGDQQQQRQDPQEDDWLRPSRSADEVDAPGAGRDAGHLAALLVHQGGGPSASYCGLVRTTVEYCN